MQWDPGPPFRVIAHLSDLHLGRDFNDVGDGSRASIAGLIRTRRLSMQAHDAHVLASLRPALIEASRAVGASGLWDYTVITGDISTNADCDSRFDFAKQFVTTATVNIGGGMMAGIGATKAICVPGNHDKLGESTPARYIRAFGGFPKPPPYVLLATKNNSHPIVFIGIDSNRYEDGEIAVGKVSPATLGWLNTKLSSPSWPAHATVLLLLHHHPANLNPFRPPKWMRWQDRFTALEEGSKLLKACAGRVHLILHGHEHFPVAFREQESGAVVVSAGTTSEHQRNGQGNNFMMIALCPRGIAITPFIWNGGRFAVDRNGARVFGWPHITR